ncbi:MAG TPA: MBL fold metallo-hydrolase [Burkholderiaceae bacterium]|nr:MBL fold metallo-hydrolase [Burkholderiaceae bacterium]
MRFQFDRPALASTIFAALAAAVIVGCASTPVDPDAAIARANQAMGGSNLKSIRYAAEGTGYTFGQAFVPGAAWPKITVHSQTRSINYDTGSMREEIALSRAEPTGGGGYPLMGQGQQRNDQFVSGGYAWNATAGGPAAGPRFVADRTHQLWITPHGVIKAAQRNKATAQARSDGSTALTFSEPGRFKATAIVGADALVQRIDSRVPDPVLGEVDVVTRYSNYRDVGGGVKFPGRIEQSMAGQPVLDVQVSSVEPNAAVDIAVPDVVHSATERVTTDKIADGLWFVGGGSHNSVAIEMKDHLVLVEAPLSDGRSMPVIDAVKALAPGKPIRYVINSHQHFDHAGGLRAAAAEGATIVTQAANVSYLERAFATPNAIAPDRLAASGRKASFMPVTDRAQLSDGTRTIDIHRITDSVHNDTFLMVHLPAEKVLIEADAYTPPAAGAPPAATPNANNVNLIANIERLKLNVERIAPLHGRVVPLADLYAYAGRQPPR